MFDARPGAERLAGDPSGAGLRVHTAADDERAVLAELDRLVGQLGVLVERTASAASWTGQGRARTLRLLDRVPGLLAVLRSPVLVAQRAAAAAAGNEREFLDGRARLTGTSRFQAVREVGTAEALGALPLVRDAVADAEMPVGHADVLARTLNEASTEVTSVLTDEAMQSTLVELARGTEAREFARALAALVAEHDPEHLADARAAARRARFLHVTHGTDGTFLKGRLDPVTGEVLARALDATGHRQDEDRTAEQARADALAALAQHALTGGMPGRAADGGSDSETSAGPCAGTDGPAGPRGSASTGPDDSGCLDGQDSTASRAPAAQVSLLVPAATWIEVLRLQRERRSGSGAHTPTAVDTMLPSPFDAGGEPSPPPTVGQAVLMPGAGHARAVPGAGRPEVVPRAGHAGLIPPATTEDGTPVSHTELARALCDCAATRVVLDERGLPLDVGRTRRMFTPAQRTAVVARDRVCAWNGCAIVPRYCEVHHIRWWEREGGRTDLANGVLLCSHHHHQVHDRDLDIVRLTAPVGLGAVRYEFRDRTGRRVNAPDERPG